MTSSNAAPTVRSPRNGRGVSILCGTVKATAVVEAIALSTLPDDAVVLKDCEEKVCIAQAWL